MEDLYSSSNLKLREDMLTGESDDVVKDANTIVDMDSNLYKS